MFRNVWCREEDLASRYRCCVKKVNVWWHCTHSATTKQQEVYDVSPDAKQRANVQGLQRPLAVQLILQFQRDTALGGTRHGCSHWLLTSVTVYCPATATDHWCDSLTQPRRKLSLPSKPLSLNYTVFLTLRISANSFMTTLGFRLF